MKSKIRDADNRKHLTDAVVALKEILALWYRMQSVMKSKRAQSDEQVAQFKQDTIALNRAIQNLITHPPVPGCILEPSRQLKFHLLFGGEIVDWLEAWLSLGAMDEQNIEGIHPEFIHLSRQFDNCRGALKKRR